MADATITTTPDKGETQTPAVPTPKARSKSPAKQTGNPARRARTATRGGDAKKGKSPALYHLFQKGDKGVLMPVGDIEAKTAEGAVTAFLDAPPNGYSAFAKQVREGKAVVVVVPRRNYTEVGAEEEIKRTLRIKAKK